MRMKNCFVKKGANLIAFCAEDGKGTYDELVIDFYNREYSFHYKTQEKFLYGKDSDVLQIKLSHEDLHKIFDFIENIYPGEQGPAVYLTEDDWEKMESGKPVIDRETLWKAIKRELSQKELDGIISYDYRYEKDDYYDYKLIISGIHAVMAGEISVSYYTSWLVLLMRCLGDNTLKSGKLRAEYAELADLFDGCAFMDYDIKEQEKLIECRGAIATVKNVNHTIENIRKHKTTDFTTNGVITYVSHAFSIGSENRFICRVCVVDKKRKRVNYMYVPEVDYREDINYTFLSEAEFENLPSLYWEGYKLDLAMDADYAATKKQSPRRA